MAEKTEKSAGAENAASAGAQQVTLTDGRVADVRPAKGKDVRKAGMMAGGSDTMSIMMGLAASCTSLDGKSITYEEMDELPAMDVFALIGATIGGNALSQALKLS